MKKSKPEEQLIRWQEHFQEVLNRPPPTNPPSIERGQVLKIKTGPITKTEVTTAMKHLKNGKVGGIDNLPSEAIKALDNISINNFHNLLNMIWEEEQVPDYWTKGILVKLHVPKKGDRSICGNWRGVMLLSIPSKLFCHIVLHRMRKEVDRVLREE